MEQSDPSAPSDIVWQPVQGQPTGGQPAAPAATPSDISWAPSSAPAKKEPGDWHVLKAIARGVLEPMEVATGDKPEDIAYRNKLLGIDDPGADSHKGAEFVGGLLSPSPMGIAKAGGAAAAKLADKAAGTLGMSSGSETLQYIERSLARLPGGDFLRHAIKSVNSQLGNQSADLIGRLADGADTSATGAGKVIEEQMKVAAQRMKDVAAAHYDEVEKLIPPDTKIGVKNTLRTLQELTTPTAGAEQTTSTLINPALKAVRTGLEKDVRPPAAEQTPSLIDTSAISTQTIRDLAPLGTCARGWRRISPGPTLKPCRTQPSRNCAPSSATPSSGATSPPTPRTASSSASTKP